MIKNTQREGLNMSNALLWILGSVAVIIIILLLIPGKESKETSKDIYLSEGEESAVSRKIEELLKKAKEDFILLNNFTLKGWVKHKAAIPCLLITKKGLYIFKTFTNKDIKSVTVKDGDWFVETEKGKTKVKNPINMNNYRLNIIRNILKKKLGPLYDRLDFKSVVVVKDDANVPVSSEEKGKTFLIKEQFIPDFVDMIAQLNDKITVEEMQKVKEALT
jgi:hypothetical protein